MERTVTRWVFVVLVGATMAFAGCSGTMSGDGMMKSDTMMKSDGMKKDDAMM